MLWIVYFLCYVAPVLLKKNKIWSGRPSSPCPQAKTWVESSWSVIAHGDAREGNWRGNWRMEWVASTFHTTSEHGVSSITTADEHNSAASSRLNWSSLADLNGLVRFAGRRNLVFERVPSHFKRSLTADSAVSERQRFSQLLGGKVRCWSKECTDFTGSVRKL